ncbi:MAG: hypothetical protein CSA72_09245 [Rhodobacterales bacterium]|nr:MAG: hypothetical protein CSA72_09245 [Rhodobacterales bacterium]
MTREINNTADALEANAIPRLHEVHTDNGKSGDQPLPAAMQKPAKAKSPAQWAYERMILYIKKFEETLDEAQEIAMGFTGSDAGLMRIEGMGFFDPDMVTFYGTDPTGQKVQLVQHVTQLSVMLRAMPRRVEEEKPIRIGFRLAADLEQSDGAAKPEGDTPETA